MYKFIFIVAFCNVFMRALAKSGNFEIFYCPDHFPVQEYRIFLIYSVALGSRDFSTALDLERLPKALIWTWRRIWSLQKVFNRKDFRQLSSERIIKVIANMIDWFFPIDWESIGFISFLSTFPIRQHFSKLCLWWKFFEKLKMFYNWNLESYNYSDLRWNFILTTGHIKLKLWNIQFPGRFVTTTCSG